MNITDYTTLRIANRIKIASQLFYDALNSKKVVSRKQYIELLELHLQELKNLEANNITPLMKERYQHK